MKKLIPVINCSLFIFHCSLSLAVCPAGYTEVDAGALYAFHASACPSGYTEVSSSVILPSPVGGSDSKGSFTYGVCNVQ